MLDEGTMDESRYAGSRSVFCCLVVFFSIMQTSNDILAAFKYRVFALLSIPVMALAVSPVSMSAFPLVDSTRMQATATQSDPQQPSCPLTAKAGRTIVDFGDGRLLSGGQKETTHKSVSLAAGTYGVTLVAWDGYVGRETVSQAHEQWNAVVADGSGVIAKSSSSGDVPDNIREATWQGVTDAELVLSRSGTTVYGEHSFYSDTSSPNSVEPICAAFDKKETPEPTCDTFTATPDNFAGGGTTTLAWTTTNATNVSIDNGVGSVSEDGSTAVSINASKTFTLTAANDTGSVTCTAPVVVAEELHPSCDSFSASPATLAAGGGSATLTWATTNATNVTIDHGVGSVSVDGTKGVTVNQDTTFTLVASDDNESITCTTQIDVAPPPNGARCDSFTASPTTFSSSPANINLTWATTDATAVSINNDVGTVAADGSKTVSVSGSKTFTLTATGAGGNDTCQVNVTYDPPSGGGGSSSPYCRFKISDKKITAGEEVTLSWDNDRTNDITIKDDRGNVIVDTEEDDKIDEDKDSITVKPDRDTKYTLTAIRGTKKRTCTVDVEVEKKVTVTTTREQQPLTNTIELVTIPYTGFDLVTALTITFYSLLALWALGTLYILVTNKNPALKFSAIRNMVRNRFGTPTSV